jgi:hypothetical protein
MADPFAGIDVDRGESAKAAFLIIGIPGAGKSTVARTLAARFERAAHIEVDVMQTMIVSGGVWPSVSPQPGAEAERQILLRARNACLLASSFAAAGFVPVIDDVVVRRGHLDFYLRQPIGPLLRVVVLAPEVRIAISRDEARPEKTVGDTWAFLDAAMRTELAGAGLWLDTSGETEEETVERIVSAMAVPS